MQSPSRNDAIVAERLREENEAKKLLAKLEELDTESAEFEQKLRLLQASVVAAANVLVGPFAAMLDRARDAISGKS